MSREFSADFANRLREATIRFAREIVEFKKASYSFPGGRRAMEDQFRQIMGQHIQNSKRSQCLMANRKIEFKRCPEFLKELQAIKRNAESYRRSLKSMRRRQWALLKRPAILKKIELTIDVIKALNTIADEEVSVQRMETQNASDNTDCESTTVEMLERKVSSEVDDWGTTAGKMEKVEEFLTDGKLTTSEKQSSEILPDGQSSEEELGEVKQSSSGIDQSSIADRIEAQQELSEVAGRSNNKAIELQKSTAIDADRTGELMEGLAQLEKCLAMLGLMKKCIGLPEEASYTDEKSKERLEKQSSSGIDQSSIADRIEARQELSEVAGRSNNEAMEWQTSTATDADRTRKRVEGLAQLDKCLAMVRLVKKCIVLPEEASYTYEKSKERLEKQSSSGIDQSSIADRIEAQQELSEVAGRSHNEAIELQTSTATDADRTRELVEGLAQLEICLARLRRMKKCVGLPEEASYTDEKSKERLEKLSFHFRELYALFDELETVKKEFLEL